MTGRRAGHGAIPPLTAGERAHLEAVAGGQSARLRRRAQILLLADRGLPTREIAAAVGLSASRVRYWLRRFRVEGMAVFPDAAEAEALGQGSAALAPRSPEAADAISLDALCQRYSVDMAHARHVARLALRLFDMTRALHGLPAETCRLLEAAAMLHNIAYEIDPTHHHILGRDIILERPLVGFTDVEQRMVACMTAFHRKKPRPEQDPVFATLDQAQQQATLALTALLRVADGLDYSQTQTCAIVDAHPLDDTFTVVVEGEYADLDGAYAEKRADVWAGRFGVPLRVSSRYPARPTGKDAGWARLDPELSLPEAGRVLFGHYLSRVEQHADLLREGRNDSLPFLERDAARLLGLFEVFEPYFDATVLAGFKKDVRWLARHAYDAVVARAAAILMGAAPGAAGDDSGPLAWESEADRRMRKLRKLLDSRRYRDFLSAFWGFARRSGWGVFPGGHTRVSIGTQAALLIWREFTALRVQCRSGDDLAGQWRCVQRFYHMLQYLASLLGAELPDVLAVVQPLETRLHSIVLGQAALDLLESLGGEGRKRIQRQLGDATVVDAAIAAKRAWLADARSQIDAEWAALTALDFRRKLALAVAAA